MSHPFQEYQGAQNPWMHAELGVTQSSANTDPKQHHGSTDHHRNEDEGAQVEQYSTNQLKDAQPIPKTSPGSATAPSSLAVFRGMWWIPSPVSPWHREKQQDEEALANRLLVPGVNNINRLPAIY